MTRKFEWRMSPTCIAAFKACSTRFRLGYIEGLRLTEATESQRIGTNWHGALEVARMKPDHGCLCLGQSLELENLADPECPICRGDGLIPEEEPIVRATNWLDARYAIVPDGLDPTTWAVERVILAYTLAGWLWHCQNDEIETVATEIQFELPLRSPTTGRALPKVSCVGKIDRIIRIGDRFMLDEYKSTTKPIDSGSSYWQRLRLDTQISFYSWAVRCLQMGGQFAQYGITSVSPLISGVLYDVWHKPGIRPKKLTQADSKKFVKSGEYFNQTFTIEQKEGLWVDGILAEIEPGKKADGSFAIRETPEMFGARLLHDIYTDPGKYFARKEIARTDDDLQRFQFELFHIYQSMRLMNRHGHWWMDESQCEATFRCPYTPICYHGLDVCDGQTTPPGFRRIFEITSSIAEED